MQPAVVENNEQHSTTQAVGRSSPPATVALAGAINPVPAEVQRPRRVKAGSRLRGILAEEKRAVSDIETEESEADTDDTVTGESNCPSSQCCCVCSAAVSAKDILVHCRAPQCSATAHCTCAGYKAKGAKRAKFYCPTCQAKKLLAKPSKTKTQSPSPIATVSSQEATHPTTPKRACLCNQDNFCSSCTLQAVANRLSKSLSDSRRQNQALQLHILSLEERICALE